MAVGIMLTVEQLIESGCLSKVTLLLNKEDHQASINDDNVSSQTHVATGESIDNDNNGETIISMQHIRNAIKVSLLLTKTFAEENSYNEVASFGLHNFSAKLMPVALENSLLESVVAQEEQFIITSNDQFNNSIAAGNTTWVLVDMESNLQIPAQSNYANDSTASVIESLGKHIYHLFTGQSAPTNHGEDDPRGELVQSSSQQASKTRRAFNHTSLFDQLLQSGYPATSVCRLLNDLIIANDSEGESSTQHHPITSLDEIIQDLGQMNTQPHIYLVNPENEFYSTPLIFGQRYYGRSNELAKLLDVTTVTNNNNNNNNNDDDIATTPSTVVLVSGKAGVGKSFLVSAVSKFSSTLGYTVLRAKFKNRGGGLAETSRDVVSGLFDSLVSELVRMKHGSNTEDVGYSQRAAGAISSALDADSLSSLADFVPSIQALIPEVAIRRRSSIDSNNSHPLSQWQLIYLLTQLLVAILGQGRKIFVILDDVQWTEPSMLNLLSEVFDAIYHYPNERQNLTLVGIYREDEVTDDLRSFNERLATLQQTGCTHVTDIRLSTLSLDDVIDVLMNEMRLPRRLVYGLAKVVHKSSAGHALYMAQLLNSLVADSTVCYSPRKQRFDWDEENILHIKTPDSVASFIINNLSSLPADSLQCLRIISCFGIQVDFTLLRLLEDFKLAPKGGFEQCIHDLANQGVIELVGPLITFCHDVIQESVYKGTPDKERRQLHLDIGIFLSSKTSLDTRRSSESEPLESAIEQLYLSDAASNNEDYMDVSSLVSIATSQINSAGPECISDRAHRIRFAQWNRHAGNAAAGLSSFRSALYFYKFGLKFLDDDVWLEGTYSLSLKLHEGLCKACSALAEVDQIATYSNAIIANTTVLEDSLVAHYLLIRALTVKGDYRDAVARGVAALRQVKFAIPEQPTPLAVMQSLRQTEQEAEMYDFSRIDDNQRVDSKTRNIMKLAESVGAACYQTASPFLPLISCAACRFSMQNGICEESASEFATFAYFQIFINQAYDKARHLGMIAKKMLDIATVEGVTVRARFKLDAFVLFWFIPLKQSSMAMQNIYDVGLKTGETEAAYMAICFMVRLGFFEGHDNLSTILDTYRKYLPAMARFSRASAEFTALDLDMISKLIGRKSDDLYTALGENIHNKQSLLKYAQRESNFQIIEAVHLANVFISFWMGDWEEAQKNSEIAMTFPSAKMPKSQRVYHMFYRGIIAFTLYRDGKGEKWLAAGKKVLDQMETMVNCQKKIFENKLILMEAEHYASMCNVVAAKESYDLAIKIASDNGCFHEQGLGYECMGKYLKSIVEIEDADKCFMNAHKCYLQWGAVAAADNLWKRYNLDSKANLEVSNKHGRDE